MSKLFSTAHNIHIDAQLLQSCFDIAEAARMAEIG